MNEIERQGLSYNLFNNSHSLDSLKEKWERLDREAKFPNIFYNYSWVKHWWKQFGNGKEYRILVILDNQDNWLAVFPFVEVPAIFGKGLWPISYHTHDWSNPTLQFQSKEVHQILQIGLHALLEKYLFVWLPLVQEKFYQEWHSNIDKNRNITRKAGTRSFIQFPDENEKQRKQFLAEKWGSKFLKNNRYQLKQLEQKGDLLFKVLDVTETQNFFPLLVELESRSWKAKNRSGLFFLPHIDKIYKNYCPELVAKNQMRISTLFINQRLIAYEIGFTLGKTYGMHNIAYDEDYKKYSPGRLLMSYNLNWTVEMGFECFDFLQGNQDYKLRFATENESVKEISIFAPRFKAWLNYKVIQWAQKRKKIAATNENQEI